jgi:hypothetical protein
MGNHYFNGRNRLSAGRLILVFLLLGLVLSGCQAKEPPLSPAAAAFKKEVQNYLDRLCQGVMKPLEAGDMAGLWETLKNLEPGAAKLCRMCPFNLAVLDKNGDTLMVYPHNGQDRGSYSSYKVVVQTRESHKINQQRFFLQGGSQIYIICAPLLQGKHLVGIMALSVSVEEAKKRWGLTAKDFLAINFNQRS